MKLWLIGSLAIYICIQIIVIVFGAPASKKLVQWVFNPENDYPEENTTKTVTSKSQ
jgi:hypothetical protein